MLTLCIFLLSGSGMLHAHPAKQFLRHAPHKSSIRTAGLPDDSLLDIRSTSSWPGTEGTRHHLLTIEDEEEAETETETEWNAYDQDFDHADHLAVSLFTQLPAYSFSYLKSRLSFSDNTISGNSPYRPLYLLFRVFRI